MANSPLSSFPKPEFLSYEDVVKSAEGFLDKYNNDRIIPVDIEHILEIELGIKIIPLKMANNQNGFISSDFSCIYINQHHYQNRINRAKFTIAHELGHKFLHEKYYKHRPRTNENWKYFQKTREDRWSFFEYHADCFAGVALIPTLKLQESLEPFIEKVQNLKKMSTIDCPDDDQIYQSIADIIKDNYKVSFKCMSSRIKKSGILK